MRNWPCESECRTRGDVPSEPSRNTSAAATGIPFAFTTMPSNTPGAGRGCPDEAVARSPSITTMQNVRICEFLYLRLCYRDLRLRKSLSRGNLAGLIKGAENAKGLPV